MLGMLVAYDDDGNVIGTLDYVVRYGDDGTPLGLADFEAHEAAGGEHTAIWKVEGAKGSKVWPEWIGARAHDFKVELEGKPGRKRIAALVHAKSGHRRARPDGAIAERIAGAFGAPADIRDLVGGPDRPILLDEHGRNAPPIVRVPSTLPLASAVQQTDTAGDMAPADAPRSTGPR